jgi:plastocyanin
VLIGSVLGVSSAQAKPSVIQIQAGALHPTNSDAPYEFTRFYPDSVKVHPGDTVRWKILGFHTVTFSKIGRAGFFRRDEIPQTYAWPEESAFGSGCGQAANPCTVNPSTKFVGSGAPLFSNEPVNVKVNLPVGKYTYFCQIHAGMSGTIEVVKVSTALPAQAQINAVIKSAVRKDAAAMDKVFKADQIPVSRIDADGVRSWQVKVGDITPDNHVQVIAYLPGTLKISSGERVHFSIPKTSLGDPHTVTFPTELVGNFDPVPHGLGPFGVNLSCDADGRASGAPGVLGLWGQMGIPTCPANLELILAPWMTSAHPAAGNAVLTPATYHDSGWLAPAREPKSFNKLPDGGGLPSTFDAEFPAAGEFSYACDVHGDFMTGTVTVA